MTFTKRYLSGSRHCLDYLGEVSTDEQLIQGSWQESPFNQGTWEARRQNDNLTLNLKKANSRLLPTVS